MESDSASELFEWSVVGLDILLAKIHHLFKYISKKHLSGMPESTSGFTA